MKPKNKIFLVLTICLLFTSIISHAKQEECPIIIENIQIIVTNSNHSISNDKLKSKKGHLFSQNTFDQDLKNLSEDYDSVEPKITIENGKAIIIISVEQRPLLNAIIIQGNNKIKESTIIKELDLKIDEEFDKTNFLEKLNKLRNYYLKKGFFESHINYEIIKKTDSSVDLLIVINEGKHEKIHKIEVIGVNSSEEQEVLNTIFTKKHSLLMNWLTGSGVYNQEIIEQDKLMITNLFQNKGYADVQVEIFLKDNQTSQTTLMIDINKGPLYKIGHLHFEGNKFFTNKDLSKCLKISSGSVYCSDNIWSSVQNIKDLYGKYGYMNASIDVRFCLHENEPIYDIYYCIHEGNPYKVGLIKIIGNTQTKQDVILHETLICPGDIFDISRLQETETRLKNTGYFKSVNVYSVRSQIDPFNENEEYRDVFIEVGETSTGSIGLFLGFSSLNRLFGGLELSESNFNLEGITSIAKKGPKALRGGGEYLHLKANIGEKITDYSIQWTKPHFFNTPWILGINIDKSVNKALSSGYHIDSFGGNVSATYICNIFSKYGIYYRGNHSKLFLKDKKNNIINNDDNPESSSSESGPNVSENRGFVSAIGTTFSYDSTNHPRNPSKGLRSKLSAELAGLGGKYHFIKLSCFNTLYRRLFKEVVLKIKTEIQFIEPYNNSTPDMIPLSERFFLGGETTIRGYKPFCIGPKFSSGEPKGGISSFLISEELQHPLIKKPCINAFCFVDSGYLSMRRFHIDKDFSTSVGFGVRFEFMQNVPIMLGLGWPIHPVEIFNNKKINNSQRFFFALGGIF